MPRPNRSGAATRARILEAAIEVLVADGYAGFTLQAVATRAEIRYGNVTHHYPTRDILVEAMFERLVAHYQDRMLVLIGQAAEGTISVREVVTWLIDDSVSNATAPVFLQLWAMASHLPAVAVGMARLYDRAVDAFIEAYGLDPHAPYAKGLREALYLLGTVLEGSSSIFWTRDRSGRAFRESIRDLAVDTFVDLIEQRLLAAREERSRASQQPT